MIGGEESGSGSRETEESGSGDREETRVRLASRRRKMKLGEERKVKENNN